MARCYDLDTINFDLIAELTKEFFEEQLKNLATSKVLDDIKSFLYKEMPTKAEMQAMREELADKNDIHELQKSVDAYAQQLKDQDVNVKAALSRLEQIETWLKTAAPKVGVQFEQ